VVDPPKNPKFRLSPPDVVENGFPSSGVDIKKNTKGKRTTLAVFTPLSE
jgi:hypothetical protein